MPRDGLPQEMGYVLPPSSKFVFLPMFTMGFMTPIMNGLGYMALRIPHKINAIITLLAFIYELVAYFIMIKRIFTFGAETYDFQMLLELIVISVVYPFQDVCNLLKYYGVFFKGEKLNLVEHHKHNTRMLTVVAMTAICWFLIHIRVEDEWPIPTFYRILVSYTPFLVMVLTGSFVEYMKYMFDIGMNTQDCLDCFVSAVIAFW